MCERGSETSCRYRKSDVVFVSVRVSERERLNMEDAAFV